MHTTKHTATHATVQSRLGAPHLPRGTACDTGGCEAGVLNEVDLLDHAAGELGGVARAVEGKGLRERQRPRGQAAVGVALRDTPQSLATGADAT